MDGKDILQTLIELLEAQEQIKITYTVREREESGDGKQKNESVLA